MSRSQRFKDFLYFAPRLVLVLAFMAMLGGIALSNFEVLEPYLFPLHLAQGPVVSYGDRVTIGHFPEKHELARLKKESGIDCDISLLNDQLPQERALNAQLAKAARGLGMEFRNYPLSYLGLKSNENQRAIADLVAFVRNNGSRKVYIHCYLGRHRVKEVREELVRHGVIPAGGTERE